MKCSQCGNDLTQGNYFLDFLDSVDTTFGE